MSQRTLYDLEIQLDGDSLGAKFQCSPLYVGSVAPGGVIRLSANGVGIRRGVYRWPKIYVTTSFPFGIFVKRQTLHPAGELVVTPRLLSPHTIATWCEATIRTVAQKNQQMSGESFQYLTSREWLPTSPVRRWDFAAWARLGKPIVREFEAESAPRILVWVDASQEWSVVKRMSSSNLDGDRRFFSEEIEAVYSLAATLIRGLEFRGVNYRVCLSCERSCSADSVSPFWENAEGVQTRLAAGTANPIEQSIASLELLATDIKDADMICMVTSKTVRKSIRFSETCAKLTATIPLQIASIDASLQVETESLGAMGGLPREDYGSKEYLAARSGDASRTSEGRGLS